MVGSPTTSADFADADYALSKIDLLSATAIFKGINE